MYRMYVCMYVSYLVLVVSVFVVSVLLSYDVLAFTNACFLLSPPQLMRFAGTVFHASAFRMHLCVC